MSKVPPLLLPSALALMLCLLGALLFVSIDTVLPWMLGPMVVMALASMAELPVSTPPAGLPLGQLIIGTALGLYFTDAVLQQLLHYLPYILAGAAFALSLGVIVGRLLGRLSGCDARTGYFASLPGGAAEMAVLAERFGGRADLVAAAQALRIMLVVLIVPPFLTWTGVHGSDLWSPSGLEVNYLGLVLMVLLATLGALILRTLDTPNSWVIGPLLIVITLTSQGVALSAVPVWVLNAAQLLIGCALGSRFRKGLLHLAPRFLTSVVATICCSIALAAGAAWILATLSGINIPTSILALAPGGVAEMSVTAKVLQFDVPIVTAFHVTRMAILVLTAGLLFKLHRRYTTWRSRPAR